MIILNIFEYSLLIFSNVVILEKEKVSKLNLSTVSPKFQDNVI